MQTSDEKFMERALQLAKMGEQYVAPNPKVGAVIVHNNQIIGEGFHQRYGEAHAEVNAIRSVQNKALLKEATIYVTLEPCSHFGKTPPCTDLLIKHQLSRVVICNRDPFEQVNGSGIKKLKDKGIQVNIGVLEKEGLHLNRRFFTFHKKKRPYIVLKWAETADGYMYSNKQANNWISNGIAKQLVHKWRAEESAILVGKNTVLVDNPELTTREVKGPNPVRVIIDRHLAIPSGYNVFNGVARTYILNDKKELINENVTYKKSPLGESLSKSVCEFAYREKLLSIIIEGGQQILTHFIKYGCWDEARIFSGNQQFNEGLRAPNIQGENVSTESIASNQLNIIRNNQV